MSTIKPFQEISDYYSPRITDDGEIIIVDIYGRPISHNELLELKALVEKSCTAMTPEKIQHYTYIWEESTEQEKVNHQLAASKISKKTVGCIYVLKLGDSVFKIGRTQDFKSRINNYKTHTIAKVEVICLIQSNDIVHLEAELHKKFNDKRVDNREYFSLNVEDIEYLKIRARESELD